MDPCCENCVIKHVEDDHRPTGNTRTRKEWDEQEILRWIYYRLLLAEIRAGGGVPMGGEPMIFVIGTRYFEQEWALFECWIEICLDTMMRSYEACNKNSGAEYWVTVSSEDITRTLEFDLHWEEEFPWLPKI